MYLTIVGSANGASETTRLGIAENPVPLNSSFLAVPGLSDPTGWSFQSVGMPGKYIALAKTLSGTCAGNYPAPSGDVYLDTPSSAGNAAVTWTVYTPPPPNFIVDAANVTHTLNKRIMGCHSDPGYVHEPRGFYSQMIYGEAFEQCPSGCTWNNVQTNGATGTVAMDSSHAFGVNNLPSLRIDVTSAGNGGVVGSTNRGLGNEGLFIEGGKDYNGYLFVWAQQGPVQLTVQLNDYLANNILATQTISVPASSGWAMVNFSLTASAGTACNGITPGSDPAVNCGKMGDQPGHICVKCSGEFVVGVSGVGGLNVGYVFLQKGSWGTMEGIPVQKAAAETLRQMGITMIRQGGTVAQGFRWKDWRGPAWQRPSLGHVWGISLVSGWGPFEFFDMCQALGIEPVITLAEDLNTAEDWADLVEYLYGDNSTTWGAQRIADGHPVAYDVKVFELGNEQYNSNFVEQVMSMEARRAAVGAPELHYMFPTNQGLNAADAAALVQGGVNPEKVMPDIHIGAGGALPVAADDFAAMPSFDQMAINVETNAATHDLTRALQEAADLSDWFNALPPFADRLYGRAASFCTSRSGHFDGFDQGISFFLPNMTWIQPPGYVHAMITATWADLGLAVYDNSTGVAGSLRTAAGANAFAVTSQLTTDGKTIYIRVVNQQGAPQSVTLNIVNAQVSPSVTQWVLTSAAATDANTPANPTLVSPQQTTVQVPAFPATVTVPPSSYTIWAFSVLQ